MKKYSVLRALFCVIISLTMVAALAGCGAKNQSLLMGSSSSTAAQAPAAAPTPRPRGEKGMANGALMQADTAAVDAGGSNAAEAAPTAPTAEPRKLVKNGELMLETKEFDAALPEIVRLVEQAGGYIERQSVQGKSLRSDGEYYERSGSILARVPAGKLSTITAELGTLCNISAQSESVNDITDRYYDAQSHLNMLKTQETRLLELLAKAESLEDVIQLEQALTNCQYEIESLTGQLRRMDSQVEYSVLNIQINEVVEYNVPQQAPKSFLERLGDAFLRSGRNLSRALEDILFFLIVDGPVLLIYLVFWGALCYLCYRTYRGHKKRREAKRMAKNSPSPLPTPEVKDNEPQP